MTTVLASNFTRILTELSSGWNKLDKAVCLAYSRHFFDKCKKEIIRFIGFGDELTGKITDNIYIPCNSVLSLKS